MPLLRSVGRWGMIALMVNCVIGSGIFGIPGELIAILGRASPLAMLAAGLGMTVIVLCFAEVAAQFPESGGPYLYVRTAFGRFPGMQVGWFNWLAAVGGAAANTSLFAIYFAGFVPWAAQGWQRAVAITGFVAVPTMVNYIGVQKGSKLSGVLAAIKLLALGLLIFLGLVHFSQHSEPVHVLEFTAPGWRAWLDALLVTAFAYGGFENAVMPVGEVENPQRTIPFSLSAAMLICVAVYVLVQFVTVATIGTVPSARPLAALATVLIGGGGATFIGIAVMVSTYGNVSAHILSGPRLIYSLAAHREFPAVLGKVHSRFNTPHVAIALFGAFVWLLALTGTFRWILALTAASLMIVYGSTCATLVPLRRRRPNARAFRLPFGRAFAMTGVVFALALVTRVEHRQALLMSITAMIATVNWWWTKKQAQIELQMQPASPGGITTRDGT
jgi:basic amino acid/polyamine antiporter, APA family